MRKGKGGEREVVNALNDRLGEGFAKRALSQARDSGEDIEHGMDHAVAIEVKRWGSRAQLMTAILQVEQAAAEGNRIPALAFRCDGGEWRYMPIMDADRFCDWLREMDDEPREAEGGPRA
ncbi:MAG: hypothetical protein AAF184_09820 [Pseudomonadota bacterium]